MQQVSTFDARADIRIGFLVNPLAGIGGPAANKGSDDQQIQARAHSGELPLRAPARAQQFLAELVEQLGPEQLPLFVSAPGVMGLNYLLAFNIPHELTVPSICAKTTAVDTHQQLLAMLTLKLDLLIFVGGDGTARDVCRVVGTRVPVLGIPAGVKMHSGVFAVAPQPAAEIVKRLITGQLTALIEAEVRDIDEVAFREGRVKSRHFGEMLVPAENQFVQAVKQGGMELEELVLINIADEIRARLEMLEDNTLLVFGPGSTTQFIQKELGLESTLLGVDVAICGPDNPAKMLDLDVNASELLQHAKPFGQNVRLAVTAIGGQGHIIGRGNQQLSPDFLSLVGKINTWVVATKTKLERLEKRPLLIDSADSVLDTEWAGFIPVICGYQDVVLYPLGWQGIAKGQEAGNINDLVTTVIEQCKTRLDKLGYSDSHFDSHRLFHGRGGNWVGLEWCCVDYFAPNLLVTVFREPPAGFIAALVEQISGFRDQLSLAAVMVQRRFETGAPISVEFGVFEQPWVAQRKALQFKLSANQQNVGFFLDIEPARAWLEAQVDGKRVLNLFSYTCAFSVVALAAGADSVINIDMSKKALAIGRDNHKLNNLQGACVKFLPHNIFKSWGKLKREGPFDVVIIDPPSYQKGSFVANGDYVKVLRKMDVLVAKGGCFLACCNAPEVSASDLKNWVTENTEAFGFEQRLDQSPSFPDVSPERALKMLVFRNVL